MHPGCWQNKAGAWTIAGDLEPDVNQAYVEKREALEAIVKDACRELMWSCGPTFNNLPTPRKLERACTKANEENPYPDEPSYRPLLNSLSLIETYLSWLPSNHHFYAKMALQHLRRYTDELIIMRQGLRELRQFQKRPVNAVVIGQLWDTIESIVRRLHESVGVDIWGIDR
jgi:hypothetical protein